MPPLLTSSIWCINDSSRSYVHPLSSHKSPIPWNPHELDEIIMFHGFPMVFLWFSPSSYGFFSGFCGSLHAPADLVPNQASNFSYNASTEKRSASKPGWTIPQSPKIVRCYKPFQNEWLIIVLPTWYVFIFLYNNPLHYFGEEGLAHLGTSWSLPTRLWKHASSHRAALLKPCYLAGTQSESCHLDHLVLAASPAFVPFLHWFLNVCKVPWSL